MEKYRVTINNKVYEVELEKVEGDFTPKEAQVESAPQTATGSATLKAPIQGTVLSILAKPGQKVAKGETVMVIEAMKLENEIVSDRDGVVKSVLVSEKAVVNNGQDIIEFEG